MQDIGKVGWAVLCAGVMGACGGGEGSGQEAPDPRERVQWKAPTLRANGPQQVTVGAHGLMVNGEPFFVRGAGYLELMPSVVPRGGNSVRTWGETTARATLDEARELGLLVAVGLWVAQPRQGFDYGNAGAVRAHVEMHERAIDRHKDDPALLIWGIGNEVNMPHADGKAPDPRAWDAIEQIAAHAHEVDPNHPVMSVVTDITPELIAIVKERAPSLDLLGINSYEGLPTLPSRLAAAGWDKPYLVTEWSGPGAWASETTPWGAPIELTSGEKADAFALLHDTILGDARCFGSYAFAWGHVVAPTPTWFSLFDGAARPTELLDALEHAWKGTWPQNRAPHLSQMRVAGAAFAELTGGKLAAEVTAMDSEGDALTYTWEVRADHTQPNPDGVGALPPLLSSVTTNTPTVMLDMPAQPGPYRVYVTAADGKGGVGVANAPVLVKGAGEPVPVTMESRFHLGDFYEGKVSHGATLSRQAITSVWDQSSQLSSVREQVAEGFQAQRATVGISGWLGLGVAYTEPVDVTGWTTLHVQLRSREAKLAPLLSLIIGDDVQVAEEKGSIVLAKDYGFVSDGKWHELVIPLADFEKAAPVNLAKLTLGFGLSAAPAEAGGSVDIDGLYLSAE